MHWEKPNLGLVPYKGQSNTNIVFPPKRMSHEPNCVFKDSRPDCPSSEKYKMVASLHPPGEKGGTYMAASPDGLHWKMMQGSPVFRPSDTNNICFFDNRIGRYVGYVRVWDPMRKVGRCEFSDVVGAAQHHDRIGNFPHVSKPAKQNDVWSRLWVARDHLGFDQRRGNGVGGDDLLGRQSRPASQPNASRFRSGAVRAHRSVHLAPPENRLIIQSHLSWQAPWDGLGHEEHRLQIHGQNRVLVRLGDCVQRLGPTGPRVGDRDIGLAPSPCRNRACLSGIGRHPVPQARLPLSS